MSGLQSSSSYGDTDSASSTSTTSSSTQWSPHGRGMTACLVVVNLVLVALVYLYFWRVFSRKSAAAYPSASNPMDDDDASSAASTPSPSPPPSSSQDQQQHDRLLASLPTFVARSGSGAGAECAVCIAELRDGDQGRALPRCGHRFHAACVDAWLRRRHTTCPLCRASVVVVAAEEEEEVGPKGSAVTGTTAAAAAALQDMDAPV